MILYFFHKIVYRSATEQEQENVTRRASGQSGLPSGSSSRPLNILSLGGSVTWGGGEQLKREDTYTI